LPPGTPTPRSRSEPDPDLIDTEAARLELNARHYRYDATLLLTIERRPEAMT
jgi:hypothetical protein